MEKGLVHLYCGDGKGKTTACIGLGVRACGCGNKVLMAQFLKDNKSGEIKALEKLSDNFNVILGEPVKKFYFKMDDAEKETTKAKQNNLFDVAIHLAVIDNYDILILDELIDVINIGIIDIKKVEAFINNKPKCLEVVITGHNPHEEFYDLCDYVSEVKKIKHPYDKGIKARKGIEK